MRPNDTTTNTTSTARLELFDTLREKASKLDETSFRRCLAGTRDTHPQRYYYVRDWVQSGNVDDMLKLNLSEFLNLLDVTRTLEDLYSYKRTGILQRQLNAATDREDHEIAGMLKRRIEAVGPNRLAEAIGISRPTLYRAMQGKTSPKTKARIMLFLDFGDMAKLAAKAREEKTVESKKHLDDLKEFI